MTKKDTMDHDTGGDTDHLLAELDKITTALGRMFPGLCEVVLHDLRDPVHTVRTIENSLSGRSPGDPATELGLARIIDPEYPAVLQNYPNRFPDGRTAKSTSIGIKGRNGDYVAALCLNLDVSILSTVSDQLAAVCAVQPSEPEVHETFHSRGLDELREYIVKFAASRGLTPRSLDATARRDLLAELREQGFMEIRKAVATISETQAVSRATVYNDLRSVIA